MRVLFLLTQDLESPAGAGRYFPLAKALVKLGHAVQIIGLHPDYSSLGATQFTAEHVEVSYVGQMHVRKTGEEKTYLPKHKLAQVVAAATWALSRAALDAPADVIYVGKPHPMNGVAGILARTVRHLPLVVDCDDLEAANNRFGDALQRWGVSTAEHMVIRAADHITTHSSVIRDYVLELGTSLDRITYLPHGTEVERFASVNPDVVSQLRSQLCLEDRMVVAYIGSLSSVSHALKDLIDAFRIVVRQRPQAVLLLVGGGEDYDALRSQTASLGLASCVRFCGRVAPASVPLYYRLADVAVDPVRDNEAGRASLSLKMFETWAAGKPLITVDVGDRRDVVGEPPAAVVVPPEDPNAMAQAIEDLLSDPELRLEFHRRALNKAGQYSWDGLARTVASIYEDLVILGKRGP